eukprot:jgi/Ulvmu1/749/UM010_0123.1
MTCARRLPPLAAAAAMHAPYSHQRPPRSSARMAQVCLITLCFGLALCFMVGQFARPAWPAARAALAGADYTMPRAILKSGVDTLGTGAGRDPATVAASTAHSTRNASTVAAGAGADAVLHNVSGAAEGVHAAKAHSSGSTHSSGRTLVLYAFSNTDPEYYPNLVFFVKHGVPGCHACEFIIIVNEGPTSPAVALPELPRDAVARYVRHSNECYDWGTFGWVLKTQAINTDAYQHFIFLNSSVRGPFLPTYLQGRVHFTEAMTSKLVGEVKMVGPTISCEATGTGPGGRLRSNPHVQSYAVATDAFGMRLLLADGAVFGCYASFHDTIFHSELGASAAILDAGYNLDCFMSRYQGVDWRDDKVADCNAAVNPFSHGRVDAVGLTPMELMFIKVKSNMLRLKFPSALAAASYDRWNNETATGRPEVLRNVWVERYWDARAPFILEMAAISPDCFDCDFYVHSNPDLLDMSCWDAFVHFTNYGQFDARPHRFTCDTSLNGRAVPYTPQNVGLPWPRPVITGCSPSNAECGDSAVREADLVAIVDEYEREALALKDEAQVMAKLCRGRDSR